MSAGRIRRIVAFLGVCGLIGSACPALGQWEDLLDELATAVDPLELALASIDAWGPLEITERAQRIARVADALFEAGHEAACPPVLDRVGDLSGAENTLGLLDAAAYLAQLEYAIGRFELAASYQARAVEVARALGRTESLPDLLQTLGYVHYALEDNRSAAAAWREALLAYESADDPRHADIVWLQSDLAETQRLLGNTAAAESLQVVAVERSRIHLPRDRNHAVLLNNLGSLLWEQGRLGEAEVALREAMDISTESEDETRLALAHLNLGVVLREQGKWVAAEEELTVALRLARAAIPTSDPRFAYFLVDLARVQVLTDRTASALPLLREARALLESAPRVREVYLARVMQTIGEAAERSGDLAVARDGYRRARDLRQRSLGADHPALAASLVALARVESDPAAAWRQIDAALDILAGSMFVEAEAEAQAIRASQQWQSGQADAAYASMETALALAERARNWQGGAELSRARFLERFLRHGHAMIGWLVESGDAERALLLAERFRARGLRDRLAGREVDLHRGIPAPTLEPLLAQARDARVQVTTTRRALNDLEGTTLGDDAAELRRLQAQLDRAARDLVDAEDRIRHLSPAWQALRAQSFDAADLAALRRDALSGSRSLLFYQIGADSGFGFLVPAAGPIRAFALREGDRSAGNRRIEELARGLDRPPTRDELASTRGVGGVAEVAPPRGLDQRLGQLFTILMPPEIWSSVRDLDELVVAVDGALHAVPIEALVAGSGPTYWLDAGPPVRTALSLSLLAMPATRRADGRVVSLSDPEFAGDLPPLPGTAAESRAIVAAFGADRVDVLRGSAATEDGLRARLAGARMLHLATHGIVREDARGALASLALTPPAAGDEGDGALHLFELDELHLDCELAVLSACQTQAGERIGGEGVFALSRGFLSAGARRTVASLWSVSDASTAELVGGFFAGIAAAERRAQTVPYARILRDAKRAVRSDPRWESPFFWAPFVLTGLQ